MSARPRRRLAVSAAIYAAATGLSRVLGLVREIVFARLLGAGVAANAFTAASIIPNTVRSLVADAALGASFIPVFNELLERGEDRRAWRVASTSITVATVGLSIVTALGIAFAQPIVELLPLQQASVDLTPEEAITWLEPYCTAFLYTHVDTEGLLGGINLDAVRSVAASTSRKLIAAGGNIYYLAKLAGIFGLGVQDIGAQQTGVSVETFKAKLEAAGR